MKKFPVAITATVITLLTLFPAFAAAHTGHGQGENSSTLIHYLTEPFHLVYLLCLAVVAAVAHIVGKEFGKRESRPLLDAEDER